MPAFNMGCRIDGTALDVSEELHDSAYKGVHCSQSSLIGWLPVMALPALASFCADASCRLYYLSWPAIGC